MKKTQQVEGQINNVSLDEILDALRLMEANSLYITKPVYRGNIEKWPNNQISFIDFHINYLKVHPALNPYHYLSNLRLTLKKRSY